MFTKSLRSLSLAVLASGLLFVTGCNRNNDATPDEDITTAEDSSEANIENAISADAMRSIAPADMQGATANPEVADASHTTTDAAFQAKFGNCATRTYDALARKLTIDFGTTNCLCGDGRYRRGKILVQFTTDIATRRAGAEVTRDNYFVNDNQHTAKRIFTDIGSGSFTVDVPSASIIHANNGGTHSWTANWTFTRTNGYNTPADISDDSYSVTGSNSGTNRKGVAYTITVQTPLVKLGACPKYYVSGVLSISNDKGRTMLLDYGSGACDNTATVTVNGKTKTIILR